MYREKISVYKKDYCGLYFISWELGYSHCEVRLDFFSGLRRRITDVESHDPSGILREHRRGCRPGL
jgi:hypothetical protein